MAWADGELSMSFVATAEQVAVIFVFMLLGLLAAKRRWIGDEAVRGMTTILLNFVVPCVIVTAFQHPFSSDRLRDLGVTALFDMLAFPVSVGVAYAIFRRGSADQRRTLRFGVVYSNAMFIGFPLVQALAGVDGLFFAVVYVLAFNIYAWTHGFAMFPGDGSGACRRLFSNPAIWAIVVGLALFVGRVELPGIVNQGLGLLGDMTAPLSMIIVGAGLAKVDWGGLFVDGWLWAGVAVRNCLIPLLAVLALWFVPLSTTARLATLIPLACPTAAFLVLFTVRSKCDSTFPSSLVALSTVMSMVTVPAVVALAGMLW